MSDASPSAGSSEDATAAPAAAGKSLSFAQRLLGALRLDPSVYTEVEHDATAIAQAMAIVAMAGLARGLSAISRGEQPGLFDSVLIAFIGWAIVTTLLWIVGVLIDRDTSGFFELLRTVGFAASPLILLVVSALPGLSSPPVAMTIIVLTHGWATVALLVATREALDISTARAAVLCAVVIGILTTALVLLVRHVISRIDGIIDMISSAATQ